jgi:hypothetical protein
MGHPFLQRCGPMRLLVRERGCSPSHPLRQKTKNNYVPPCKSERDLKGELTCNKV